MTLDPVTPFTPAPAPLSELDLAVLEFERTWWQAPGTRDELLRERLGMTADEYAAALQALVDHPDALAADPLVVKRLRRMRDRRRRTRTDERRGR